MILNKIPQKISKFVYKSIILLGFIIIGQSYFINSTVAANNIATSSNKTSSINIIQNNFLEILQENKNNKYEIVAYEWLDNIYKQEDQFTDKENLEIIYLLNNKIKKKQLEYR